MIDVLTPQHQLFQYDLFCSITINDLRRWLLRINAKTLANRSKQIFQVCYVCIHVFIYIYMCVCTYKLYTYVIVIKEFDVGRTGSLDYAAFEKLYHSIVNVKAVRTKQKVILERNFTF